MTAHQVGTTTARFCGQCGNRLGSTTRFCGACGAPMRAADQPLLAIPSPRRRRLLPLLVVGVLIGGAVALAAILSSGGAEAVTLVEEATGEQLELDTDVRGSVPFDAPTGEQPEARYRLSNVRAQQTLTVSVSDSTLDFTAVLLTTDDGRELARTQLFGSGRLTHTFTETGTYHIVIRVLGSATGGSFSMRVSVAGESEDADGSTGGEVQPATAGIVGVWQQTDGPQRFTFRADGTYEQAFGSQTPITGVYSYDTGRGRIALRFEDAPPDCEGLIVFASLSGDDLALTTDAFCDMQIDNPETRTYRRSG